MNQLNKYKILARILIIADQEEFNEADLKEAVDLLHQELFPEHYSSGVIIDSSISKSKKEISL